MTSITIHEGMPTAVPITMPAMTTAAAAVPSARSIETTVKVASDKMKCNTAADTLDDDHIITWPGIEITIPDATASGWSYYESGWHYDFGGGGETTPNDGNTYTLPAIEVTFAMPDPSATPLSTFTEVVVVTVFVDPPLEGRDVATSIDGNNNNDSKPSKGSIEADEPMTISRKMEVTVPGLEATEPPTLARVARPMNTGAVDSGTNRTLSHTTNFSDSAGSLLPAHVNQILAAEAIALLAGFYVWFM